MKCLGGKRIIRPNTISLAAKKVKDIRGDEDGMTVRGMLDQLPSTPAEMDKLREAVAANPLYVNTLVSPDGRAAAVLTDFRLDKANPSFALLEQDFLKVVDAERDASVRIYTGGLPVQMAGVEHHMMKMPLYFAISILVIMAIQYWSFRSIQGMLLPMISGLLSVVWALGTMGLTGTHLDALSTNT